MPDVVGAGEVEEVGGDGRPWTSMACDGDNGNHGGERSIMCFDCHRYFINLANNPHLVVGRAFAITLGCRRTKVYGLRRRQGPNMLLR